MGQRCEGQDPPTPAQHGAADHMSRGGNYLDTIKFGSFLQNFTENGVSINLKKSTKGNATHRQAVAVGLFEG